MMKVDEEQDVVTKVAMESIVKILIIVEFDRAKRQREYISKAITDGIAASQKKNGRKKGQLDKFSDELRIDIEKYLCDDRHITQTEVMRKHNVSRNTLKKYIKYVEKERK